MDISPGSAVAVDNSTLQMNGITLSVKNAGIGSTQLAADIVLTGEMCIPASHFTSVIAGDWVNGIYTDQFYNGLTTNNVTPLQNDGINFIVWLVPGTYTVEVSAATGPSASILTLTINSTVFAAVDLYNSSGQTPGIKRATGCVITTAMSGAQTMKAEALTKNASSSGYLTSLHFLRFVRTA